MSCLSWSVSGVLNFCNCLEGYGSLGVCIESVLIFFEEGISYLTVQQSINKRVLICFLPSGCLKMGVCCFAQFSDCLCELLYSFPFILLEVLELGSGTPSIWKVSDSAFEGIEHKLDPDPWCWLSLYLIEVLIREVVVLVKCVVARASEQDCSLPGVILIVCLRHCFEMAYPSLEAVEVFARIT